MFHFSFWSVPALLLTLLSGVGALAQSLAVRFETNETILLEAEAPLNLGYRIQASSDFESWNDISDQAAGAFSFWVAPAQAHQFFRISAARIEDAAVTLIMIGDSTVADFVSNSEQFYGWGQGMYGFFKPNVRVLNFATPVQSSKNFLTSVQRENLAVIKPEFVIVQFGMVDSYDLEGVKTTMAEYEANLKTIVQIIRNFGGTPILVTPPAVRVFDGAEIRSYEWLEGRCEIMRKVSRDVQTYLVDLNGLSTELFNELGPVQSEYISWSSSDPAHFTEAGATVIAELVVGALPLILHPHVVAP